MNKNTLPLSKMTKKVVVPQYVQQSDNYPIVQGNSQMNVRSQNSCITN